MAQSPMLSSFEYALHLPTLLSASAAPGIHLMPAEPFIDQVIAKAIKHPHILESIYRSSSRKPLGRIFEQIVHAALIYHFADQTVFTNVQLPKMTPGELDFVITGLNHVIHLEVAIKFFLYIPHKNPSIAQFYGPQLKDRLDLKLEKILKRQLMQKIPEKLLPAGNVSVTKALWLSGMLCYPVMMFLEQDFPNFKDLRLNPLHKKGWWCKVQDLRHAFPPDESCFRVLLKPEWLSPFIETLAPESSTPLQNFDHLTEPAFVLRFTKEGRAVDRGFIVPNDWGTSVRS